MYMLNMVIILIVMYCNVVTAIDKIPTYLLRFNIGDAVQPDGTLKDASEIVWTYDDDESIPFPSKGSASDPPSNSTTMHAPATVVAAVHQTTHISWPSRWVLEELEAAELALSAPASSGVKRKAASTLHHTTLPNHRAMHKVVDVVSDGDSDDGTPSYPPTELASDDYESLQAMLCLDYTTYADRLDCLVSLLSFYFPTP